MRSSLYTRAEDARYANIHHHHVCFYAKILSTRLSFTHIADIAARRVLAFAQRRDRRAQHFRAEHGTQRHSQQNRTMMRVDARYITVMRM